MKYNHLNLNPTANRNTEDYNTFPSLLASEDATNYTTALQPLNLCTTSARRWYGFLPIIVLSFAFLVMANTQEAKAATGIGGTGYTIECGVCRHDTTCLCADMGDGVVTFGHAKITMGDPSPVIITPDMEHTSNLTIFICDSVDNNRGVGYIKMPVYTDSVNDRLVFDTSSAILYTNYMDWRNAKNYIDDSNNYVEDKALVYPNPTNDAVFVKLKDAYVSANNIQSVKYNLYNSSQTLLGIFTTSDVGNIVQIPSSYIGTNGSYYVICEIILLDDNNVEQQVFVTLPFIVAH